MAQKKLRLISLFYSTTADPAERDRLVVLKQVCDEIKIAKNYIINLIHWKQDVGSALGIASGQDSIDNLIGTDYDIYFGTLGASFGYGVVHEYEMAIKSHVKNWRPAENDIWL